MLKTKTKKKAKVDTSNLTSLAKKIIRLRKKGWTYSEIVEEAQCSENYVYRVCKGNGLVEPRRG